jgi:hypothetical protein
MSAASIAASAQTASSAPELSVAGFRLGGDEKAAEELLKGYAPRYEGENAQPKYYFYNEYGNQVMTLTGYSKERPHLIVAIEVFGVGESYRNKHYQMKGRTAFMSESGFFIGARPSATSLMFAIPNVTGPKEVIKKKGMPEADEKSAKVRTLRYQLKAVRELEDRENKLKNVNFANYSAEYRFYKNKLSRFSIKVNTPAQNTAAL